MVLNLRKAMIEGLKKEVVCKENLQVSGCRFTKEERESVIHKNYRFHRLE